MTIRREWLRFAVVVAVLFFVVLGVPFLYRIFTSPAYSQRLRPKTAFTGTWVGVLQGPPAPGLGPRDPYFSERTYQLGVQDILRRQHERVYRTRVLYLDLGLNPFKIGDPELRGKVRMCAYNGAATDFEFTTVLMDETGAKLVLTTKASDEFGNLTLKLNDGKLRTEYAIMENVVDGVLVHGDINDFKHACQRVASTSDTILTDMKPAPQP
jgi:hypothetical protein